MKHLTWIVGLVFVFALAGCNLKQKMEEKAQEAANEMVKAAEEEAVKAAEEAVGKAAEETEETEEEAEEEGPAMAVAKEDIDKAVEIYKVMHDDDLTTEGKNKKYEELLAAAEWDKEGFQKLIYDITQDPASRTYYNEQIED